MRFYQKQLVLLIHSLTYPSLFQVATYNTEKTAEESEEKDETEMAKEDAQETDSEFWERLLRHRYEQELEINAQQLGKGKRIRNNHVVLCEEVFCWICKIFD